MNIANLTTWACDEGWMYELPYQNDNKQRFIKFEDVVELLKHANNKQSTPCSKLDTCESTCKSCCCHGLPNCYE